MLETVLVQRIMLKFEGFIWRDGRKMTEQMINVRIFSCWQGLCIDKNHWMWQYNNWLEQSNKSDKWRTCAWRENSKTRGQSTIDPKKVESRKPQFIEGIYSLSRISILAHSITAPCSISGIQVVILERSMKTTQKWRSNKWYESLHVAYWCIPFLLCMHVSSEPPSSMLHVP